MYHKQHCNLQGAKQMSKGVVNYRTWTIHRIKIDRGGDYNQQNYTARSSVRPSNG
jgi:hypothetical protein